MPHFPKPAEGSWTEHYPHLGTAPVDFADCTSPDFYEAERQHIFRKCWLNVGRIEQLPKVGSYFTKELAAVGTSVLVVRAGDDVVKAFHNICRHRGNQLVWNDVPAAETSGVCRQFQCKYHAWRYSLDGDLTFVQQEEEFFDLDKATLGLAPLQCEVWEGFVFVNTDLTNTRSVADWLGPLGAGIAGYPFHEFTEVYSYRAEINANWKLYIDAFTEFYHAPVLHAKQYVSGEAGKLVNVGFEGLHYEVIGPHAMVSSWGAMAPPKDLMMVKPIERLLRSGNFGPWDPPDVPGLADLPPGANPARHKAWGLDSFLFFPNFMVLLWKPGWYLTYHYWPTAYDRHVFECSLYFAPPPTALHRLRQELAAVTFVEFGLQDCNTLEATQTMLESYAPVDTFPLCDQEILLRHLHHTAKEHVARGGVG